MSTKPFFLVLLLSLALLGSSCAPAAGQVIVSARIGQPYGWGPRYYYPRPRYYYPPVPPVVIAPPPPPVVVYPAPRYYAPRPYYYCRPRGYSWGRRW